MRPGYVSCQCGRAGPPVSLNSDVRLGKEQIVKLSTSLQVVLCMAVMCIVLLGCATYNMTEVPKDEMHEQLRSEQVRAGASAIRCIGPALQSLFLSSSEWDGCRNGFERPGWRGRRSVSIGL